MSLVVQMKEWAADKTAEQLEPRNVRRNEIC